MSMDRKFKFRSGRKGRIASIGCVPSTAECRQWSAQEFCRPPKRFLAIWAGIDQFGAVFPAGGHCRQLVRPVQVWNANRCLVLRKAQQACPAVSKLGTYELFD
jgi:hypothetical protein